MQELHAEFASSGLGVVDLMDAIAGDVRLQDKTKSSIKSQLRELGLIAAPKVREKKAPRETGLEGGSGNESNDDAVNESAVSEEEPEKPNFEPEFVESVRTAAGRLIEDGKVGEKRVDTFHLSNQLDMSWLTKALGARWFTMLGDSETPTAPFPPSPLVCFMSDTSMP